MAISPLPSPISSYTPDGDIAVNPDGSAGGYSLRVSGTVGATPFNTLKVIDHAFRRCKIPPQSITAEMHEYAKESLYFIFSDLANGKTPSWCIQKFLVGFTETHAAIVLPTPIVKPLNVLYRTVTEQEPETTTTTATSITAEFASSVKITTLKTGNLVDLFVETSKDGVSWDEVAQIPAYDTYTDIPYPKSGKYIRFTMSDTTGVFLKYYSDPYEIPMSSVNKDTYASFSNKTFTGRPINYWFQRTIEPIINMWPSPDATAAANGLLVIWAHRNIMDVGTLAQDIEVPPRWLDAITYMLAEKLAEETPQVDSKLTIYLSEKANGALFKAREGDNDGSSTFIHPQIAAYTR